MARLDTDNEQLLENKFCDFWHNKIQQVQNGQLLQTTTRNKST